jgi:hypothetical protein
MRSVIDPASATFVAGFSIVCVIVIERKYLILSYIEQNYPISLLPAVAKLDSVIAITPAQPA